MISKKKCIPRTHKFVFEIHHGARGGNNTPYEINKKRSHMEMESRGPQMFWKNKRLFRTSIVIFSGS